MAENPVSVHKSVMQNNGANKMPISASKINSGKAHSHTAIVTSLKMGS